MAANKKTDKLQNLDFEKFRALAKDKSLSKYEKIGFFNQLREGYEEEIFKDICTKLPLLEGKKKKVLDIGPGCTDVPLLIIAKCEKNSSDIYLIDSAEMLKQLPDSKYTHKIPGKFPHDSETFIAKNRNKLDVIIIYSVLHYIVNEPGFTGFLDSLFSLMADGAQCLIGDIPNISKRNRFFSSASGIKFHQERNKTKSLPEIHWNKTMNAEIDDSLVFFIMNRARLSGLESYLLPQPGSLPMANRREDILIIKP